MKRKRAKSILAEAGAPMPDLGLLIRHEFEDMISFEMEAHTAGTPESVHRMRVGTRRMRSILRIIRPLVRGEEIAEFEGELRWLAGMLGAVRDQDVYLDWLAARAEAAPAVHRPALARIAGTVRSERAAAHAALVEALEGRRHRRFVARFRKFLTQAELHLPEAAQESVTRAVRKIGRDTQRVQGMLHDLRKGRPDPSDYHGLRIRFKRLRYALDFISLVLPPARARRWRRQTGYFAHLQDLLGMLHDRDVFIARLETAETTGGPARYRDANHIARRAALRRLRAEREMLEARAQGALT